MKQSFYFLILCLGFSCWTACKGIQKSQTPSAVTPATTSTIFLVRHAEKAKEGGRDPILTPAGEQRAQRLADLLAETKISRVYSTDYKRTHSTALPTAANFQLQVASYNPRDTSFYQQLQQLPNGTNALVVGHSNTTPYLVNQLLGQNVYPQLSESEYGKIFVVTRVGDQATCTVLKY